MPKLIAILNVVAWCGFWAFGYLALTENTGQSDRMVTAVLLAAAGGAIGMWAHLWLVRHSERTGKAQPPKWAVKEDSVESAV